ncbi:hypothetical protein C810_03743 [Lachnospiraceae bacterium A2]|nr:hypothetical protein C810_03743 [Lachnospiraceae bacterium A2]
MQAAAMVLFRMRRFPFLCIGYVPLCWASTIYIELIMCFK